MKSIRPSFQSPRQSGVAERHAGKQWKERHSTDAADVARKVADAGHLLDFPLRHRTQNRVADSMAPITLNLGSISNLSQIVVNDGQFRLTCLIPRSVRMPDLGFVSTAKPTFETS